MFALGDVSELFPATAQVAFQQADYAAWNVWSAINGKPLLPFRWVDEEGGTPAWTL